MPEYIEREAAIRAISQLKSGFQYTEAKCVVDRCWLELTTVPAADVVPVVRCKGCKHRGDETHCPMCFEEQVEWDDDGYMEVDWIQHDKTTDDGFCSEGERRGEDG